MRAPGRWGGGEKGRREEDEGGNLLPGLRVLLVFVLAGVLLKARP